MYIDLAQLGLVFATLIALLVPLGLISLKPICLFRFKNLLNQLILIQFIFVSFAFLSLSYAYIISDFSLLNVFNNSHIAIPLIFKFSGVWSNHEGSMILWLFLLSLANLISTQNKLTDQERIWISSTQIILLASIISYTLLKSNPFIKLASIPINGNGFNPLLQDIGLAIHPPILYIGYITTAIPFAIALAALIRRNLSTELLDMMQPWALISWSFLTLGVGMGSWWAYRELGWGGYWFWDPVENVSLLPWLSSSALIHSIYASKKLNTNYRWTIMLAIYGFLLSILATFLVRSGVVTSVHSFAHDPNRGIFILWLLVIYSGFSLGLFACNAHKLISLNKYSWLSRFGGINLGNIFWTISSLIILGSLLYPLILELYTGKQIAIDRSFFEQSFIPLLLPVLFLLALTLPAAWQQILPMHYRQFGYSIIIAIMATALFYYYSINVPSYICGAGFFAGILVIIRMIFWLIQKLKPLEQIGQNYRKLSFKFHLIWLVHLAAGLFAVSVAFIETNSQELFINMKEGDKVKFAGLSIHFAKKENLAIDNYLAGRIILYVEQGNYEIATLSPEVRYYPVEKSQTSESSIYHNLFYDIYAAISEITKDGTVNIKLYYKPLISWLWAICVIVFFCGLLLSARYKRINNSKLNV